MNTTLITGASSGIGEVFARRLAQRGENLLLAARSADQLAALCGELACAHRIDAQYVALDLTEAGAPRHLVDEARRRGLEVETLINNAGYGSFGQFADADLEHELKMIDLNVRSLVELTHHCLAPMRARRRGAIINVASTAAFQPVPFMATYAATKAFVLSFSEALWVENRALGIKILALCPGSTDTKFFAAAGVTRPPQSIMQTPEQVVDAALGALTGGRSYVVSGWGNYLMVIAGRLAPRATVARIAGLILRRRYQSGGRNSKDGHGYEPDSRR